MLKELFYSELKIRLLKIFLENPKKRFFQKDLLGIDTLSAVQYELKKLEKIAFIHSENQGYRKVYYLNNKFQFLPEIKNIILKTSPNG